MTVCYSCGSELNEWSESKGQIGQCRYCYAHYKRALHATNAIARLKQLARTHARKALNLGLIFKHNCTCGNEKSEMHHPDYSKPLEVVWQCKACHSAFHALERKVLNLA